MYFRNIVLFMTAWEIVNIIAIIEDQLKSTVMGIHIEPDHNKTNKITSTPSEDSDQPGYPSRLIRVVTVCSKGR